MRDRAETPPLAAPESLLLRMAVLAVVGMACAGLVAALIVERSELASGGHNVAFVLYLLHEPWVLAVSSVALLALWLALAKGSPANGEPRPGPARGLVPALALLATGLAGAGVHLVMHDFALSMDEYLALWQAEALAEGSVRGRVPDGWRSLIRALTPIYVNAGPDGSWTSQYLPVHAALLALAKPLHAQWLVSPLLTGVAVVAAAGVAKRMFPDAPAAGPIAAALVATSSQFLVTGMTYYAWQAHLAFNLVWLWLFLSPRLRVFAWAPVLGVLAMGLHRPQVHAVFALPFLVRLVFRRRWSRAALAAVVYLAGAAFWLVWISKVQPSSMNSARGIGLPTLVSVVSRLMNVGQFVGWQNVAGLVLATVAVLRWKALPEAARDLAWGIVATFVMYLLFSGSGGHGWGARYMHSVLGNFALLGAAGWVLLPKASRGQARLVALGGTALALGLLPLRLVQAEAFVRPFAAASRAVEARDVDVVVIDELSGWYMTDLVRNDPFLRNRPIVARLSALKENLPLEGKARSVEIIDQKQLEPYGIRPRRSPPRRGESR